MTRIDVAVLDLGFVQLPEWHPRSADGTCPIQAVAVRHPDGVILFEPAALDEARRSIERLQSLEPDVVHLAHDRSTWRRTT